METIFKPLPYLNSGKALLLRMLMVPNFFLIRADGLDNLSAGRGAAIYVFNHSNSLEALLVPVFLMFHLGGRTISFVIDWMYGKIPVIGWLMNMIDPLYVYHKRSTIPLIERKRPSRLPLNTVDRCCRKLESGGSIGIFPEGKRNPHPQFLARAKPGVGHIILNSGMPVIPVGIDFAARRKKGRVPAFGRMMINVGAPLDFHESSKLYRAIKAGTPENNDSSRQLHALAVETTCFVMRQLSGLCGKTYREPLPVS